MKRSAPGLRVTLCDGTGRPVARPGLASWLVRVAPTAARGTLSVALVGDVRMRTLNRRFRRRDCATDVLSFPQTSDLRPPTSGPRLPTFGLFLGDIVIATGVARRQARLAGHSELTELRVLALHGLLHLLGYDHHGGDPTMARVERRLRRKGGLREGLIERGVK